MALLVNPQWRAGEVSRLWVSEHVVETDAVEVGFGRFVPGLSRRYGKAFLYGPKADNVGLGVFQPDATWWLVSDEVVQRVVITASMNGSWGLEVHWEGDGQPWPARQASK